MRPKPFQPNPLANQENFIRDATTDLCWHRVFHRTLYVDTDRSQVVYHANYLRYFELGRTSLMRDLGYPYREVEEKGYVYPVIELGLTYHAPLFYDDPMWVHTRPDKIEHVRARFDYLITQAETGVVVCKGFTIHCALNRENRPTKIDAHTKELWEKFPK